MIDHIFIQGTESFSIRVLGDRSLMFAKLQGSDVMYAPIEGLKLSHSGCLIQFPDLKDHDKSEVRSIAIQRLKEHIKSLYSFDAISNYLKDDMAKHGWRLILIKRKGSRPKVIKWE